MSRLDDVLKPIFSYGIDWTEYKDKGGPNGDHDVATYAGQIKADLRGALKNDLKQLMLDQTRYVVGMKGTNETITIIRKRIEDL